MLPLRSVATFRYPLPLCSSLIPQTIVESTVSAPEPAGVRTLKVGQEIPAGSFPAVNFTLGPFVMVLPFFVCAWITYGLAGYMPAISKVIVVAPLHCA